MAFGSTGCSLGLLQTGKTVRAGGVEVTAGGSTIDNARYAAAGQKTPPEQATNAFPEGIVRVGVAEHVDVALSGYLTPGATGEVKVSFFERERRYALAARAGGGYGASQDFSVGHGRAGLVASYDLASFFTPYTGATLTNHWIARHTPPNVQLGPGERLAGHAWTGDGVVALAIGVALSLGAVAILVEYDRWLPAQHDPGSGFQFVPTNMGLAALRFCLAECPDSVRATGSPPPPTSPVLTPPPP